MQLFFLKLILLVIPVYLMISFGIDMGLLQLEVARESQWLLGASGIKAELYGAGIVVGLAGKPPFFFVISADCIGWKAMLFLVALVLAVSRRPWKTRVIGIVAGLTVLWLVNILRVLVVVAYYAAYGYGAAMLVHDYLWQIGMGLAALLLWVAWLRLSRNRSSH